MHTPLLWIPVNITLWDKISHDAAMQCMNDAHAQRVLNETPDTLFVLEHDPVVTVGRRLHDSNIPAQKILEQNDIAVRHVDRGGLLTYHGPGQTVLYFVVRVDEKFGGVSDFVAFVQKQLVNFFKENFSIAVTLDADNPGLWCDGKKFGSVGFRIQNGVSRHGISINVNSDLDVYNLFDPCGFSGSVMTTLEKILVEKTNAHNLTALALGKKVAEYFRDHWPE